LKLAKVPQSENKKSSSSTAERGPYKKPLREEAKRQIRRLIIDEGYTTHETMDILISQGGRFSVIYQRHFCPKDSSYLED
jgi:hypothetical protein